MSPEPRSATGGAQRARRVLERLGLAGGIRTFGRSTKTAQEAADAVGCELGQIAKSIVFLADDRPVVAVVAGDRRGDAAAITRQTGASAVRLADPDTVRAATGYPVGAVSPFDLPADVVVLVDDSLARFDTVLPAAGTADSVVPVQLDVLVRISGGRMAPISR